VILCEIYCPLLITGAYFIQSPNLEAAMEHQDNPDMMQQLWYFFQLIENKFKSDNGTPIESITITREEFLRIFPEFKDKI